MLIIQLNLQLRLGINKEEGTVKKKIINERAMTLTILFTFIISFFNLGICANAADSLMAINRSVPVSNVNNGDTFEVKYTITPNELLKETDTAKKDIVLVIDTSGSMEDKINNEAKITSIKKVASNFVDTFTSNSNFNIGIVEYSSYARKVTNILNVSDNTQTLKDNINGLGVGGATNIGDGIRTAKVMLDNDTNAKEKYIILMTDGQATAYSRDKNGGYNWRYGYYTDDYYGNQINTNNINHENLKYNLGPFSFTNFITYCVSGQLDSTSVNYAKNVTDKMLKDDNILKSFFVVGFGDGVGTSNQEIANAAGGYYNDNNQYINKGMYYNAKDNNSLQTLYNQFAEKIVSTIHGNATFQESISDNLEVVDTDKLPYGLKVENNKLTGNIDIEYTLNSDKYLSNPIEFTVKYKVKDNNVCKLGAGGNTSFVKLDVQGKTDIKYLEEKILGNSVPTQVTMEVSDSTGIIDKYDTTAQNFTSTRYDKVDNQYKLLGDSYVNIAAQGSGINFAQYQFIKSDTKPTDLPSDNWKEIDLTNEEINEDVDVDNVGNLTQRSYDVSHLSTMANESDWNNAEKVFQNPFEATTYKDAGYSNTKEEYGGWQSYIQTNGTTGQRWVTKTAFMNQMNIGLNDAQNMDYKEASKFWGYIKVPTTGSYNFAATSDDGCSADITVNGTTVKIVDMFKVQGSTFGSTDKTLQLEANKYYPIYIEYFNWGGQAEFRLQYKESTSNTWLNIPKEYFYPSKSTSPGEYATNRFTGRAGIKIPDEVGKYYIAYRTGKRDANNSITEIQKSGIYGAFIRDERFVLSRSLNNNGADNIGDEFDINYTITPNDIPVTDIYKNYQVGVTNIATTLTISNLRIQQVLPNGLTYVGSSNNVNIVNNSNEISGVINSNVLYSLVGSTYKASPVTITIKVRPTISGTFDLVEDNSILTYTDISIDATQGAQRQCNFPDFSFSVNEKSPSIISKHGIYYKTDNTINTDNLNVVSKVPTELAMIVDANSPTSVIKWSIDKSKIAEKNIVFKKYEILNGSINKDSLQTLNLNINDNNGGDISNTTAFEMKKGSQYIIIYTITPQGNIDDKIDIEARVEDTDNSKPLELTIQDLPDLF